MSRKALNSKLHTLEMKVKIARKESREIPASLLHEIAVVRFQLTLAK